MTDQGETSEFDQQAFAMAFPAGVERNFWHLARNRIVEKEIANAVKKGLIQRDDPILEIGCGPGVVVKNLRDRGWLVFGSELGAPVVLSGCEGFIWTGQSAIHLDEKFRRSVSCILVLDVIEHVEDHVGFLKDIVEAFPAIRCIILTIPARMEVWSNYDEYYGHHRRYDRRIMAKTLHDAGLVPIQQKYFFHSLYIAAAVLRLLKIRREVKISATKRPFFDRLAAWFLYTESRMLLPGMPGLSLLTTATPIYRTHSDRKIVL